LGLLTGLLTLPLAPVRGTVWIAERLLEEAERELGDETAVRRRLAELEVRHELGEISDEELAEAEDALLAQLAARREAGGSDGA
jgi:gas vesicle protein GvpG